MTEYDAYKIFYEQQHKDQVTSLHADNGLFEVRYADGTMEIYKRSKWKNKLKLIKKRT
tara:strand:- start:1715 stop:1888 length:174 start_codon:yes stop_codon:yes gene_type:complete